MELDFEIWRTCIVIPAGYHPMRGCGPLLHDDPDSRPPAVFGGKTTLHFGPGRAAFLLLPVIPRK